MEIRTDNLPTFSTLFLVKGILNLLFALLPLIYVFLGGFLTYMIEKEEFNDPPPFNVGILIFIIGGIGFVLLVALGILTLVASKFLKQIKNKDFIMVISILNCLTGILGILLGVFTIIELNKPQVKELFESQKR